MQIDAKSIRGVLSANKGGTGINSYNQGDLIYASATNTLSKLNAVASGSILISNGVNTAPSWSSKFQLERDFASGEGIKLLDSLGGYFFLGQTSAQPENFQPSFVGYGIGDVGSLSFKGLRTTSVTKTYPCINFITRDSTDTTGISGTDIAFQFSNHTTNILTMLGNGNASIDTGNLTITTGNVVTTAGNIITNKIGIGTSSPSYFLDIQKNFNTSEGIRLLDSDGGYLTLNQSTGGAGAFQPMLLGYATGTVSSIVFKALRSTTAGTYSTMNFLVRNSTDSAGIGSSDIAFQFSNHTTIGLLMLGNGNFGFSGITVPTARIHISAGTTVAGTAPVKYTSGALLTTPEVGAKEFLTDKWYGTITTGPARKEFTMNDVVLTSGRLPVITTNGRLTDYSTLTYDGSYLQSNGYKSSDGSAGLSETLTFNAVNTGDVQTLTFKNGLLTAKTLLGV